MNVPRLCDHSPSRRRRPTRRQRMMLQVREQVERDYVVHHFWHATRSAIVLQRAVRRHLAVIEGGWVLV